MQSPLTTARLLALAALLATVACMPPKAAPGALAPARYRASNAVAANDLRTLDTWEERLRAVSARSEAGTAARGPEHAYALAGAAAWLAFARDEYARDRVHGASDAALAQASRLIVSLEGNAVPAAADTTPLVGGAARVRPDLWTAARSLRGEPAGWSAAAAYVGAMEVELVRAGMPLAPGATPPACDPARRLARAEELLDQARVAAVAAVTPAPRDSAPVVVAVAPVVASDSAVVADSQAAIALPVVEPPLTTQVVEIDSVVVTEPVDEFLLERTVHFALDRAELSAASQSILAGVVRALRGRDDLTLVIEGHTDPRGGVKYNEALSRRRAASVRAFLDSAGLSVAHVELKPLAFSQRAASGRTHQDYALDRRVVLRFFETDGAELSAQDRSSDLQVESAGAGRRRGGATSRTTVKVVRRVRTVPAGSAKR